jgi:hypothetical protein
MTHDEFKIGEHFWMYGNEFRCVDKGDHYIIAVKIGEKERADPSWLNGPPFGIVVHAFDVNDIQACTLTKNWSI